jgi:thioredoxin-dependent peroxiredoxin
MARKATKTLDFALPDDSGNQVTLAGLKGHIVVLYFYPKDDTPGCTLEAADFSRLASDFAAADTKVFGVSMDSAASHCKFKDKHGLKLVLLTDEDHKVASAFGVWVEKSMWGRTFMGVERSTFLFDREGKLVRSWRKVRVKGHAESVLAAARALK